MQQPVPTRPRSAGRPRLSGTTRTRNYFNSREGKSSGKGEPTLILHSKDEVVPPILQRNGGDENDVNENPLIYSLLGDFHDDNDVFQWDKTRTVKPKDEFIHDMQFAFSLYEIVNLYRNLTRRTDIRSPSELICQPDISSLVTGDEKSSDFKSSPSRMHDLAARGPIGLLFILCHQIMSLLTNFCGNMTRCNMRRCMKIDDREEPCLFEEDGLVANPTITPPVTKSRNLLRVEERIRRELSLDRKLPSLPTMCPNSDYNAINDEIAVSQEKKPIVAKMDESFWLTPGKDLVGPEKRGGIVLREVTLTIDVGQIKLRQHPEFSAQEKALARVSCLHDQYRVQIEANAFHYSVTRVTEICRRLQSIDSKRNIEVKTSSDSRLMINPLFNDLKSSAASLVTRSESIKSMMMQIKQGWNEFLATKENDPLFRHADVELKTSTLSSYAKLSNDVKELGDEIKSTKPVLSRIQNELRSSVSSFQFLQEVESALSDLTHIFEVIELISCPLTQATEGVKSGRRRMEKYFARLLVNGHVVGDTKIEQVDWTSFSVKLSHRFNCKMSQKPTRTCVQIWKSSIGFLPDEVVCSIAFMPMQEDQLGSPRPATEEWLQFSSNRADVKGAIRLEARFVERTVKCLSLGTHMAKMPSQPTKLIRPLIGDFETYTQKTTAVKLSNYRCPDRQSMMEFKHSSGNLFTNKILFEEPLRHELIKKRQRDPTFIPSPIPITELEVQNNDVYHDKIKSDGDSDEIVMSNAFNERPYVSKETFREIFRGFKEFTRLSTRRKHHLSEVIQDVALFRFAAREVMIPSLPRKRSLFPKTVQRLPVTRQTQNCSLLITVVGGHHVPTKVEGNMMPTLRNYDNLPLSSTDVEDEKCLGVICKIKFRGKNYRTKSISCASFSPQWKETLSIPLCENLEGSSPISLQDEVIDIFLFDCVTVDLLHMGGFYEDEETKSTEYRYLAHVSVPLGIVLREGTINGFVPCYSPDYIVGYAKGKCENEDSAQLLSIVKSRQENSSKTMLLIHATSDPLTIIPSCGRPEFQSAESGIILSRVEQWSQTHLASFDSVLWPDSRGSSFLASRFLSEQAPPPGFNTLASCAQYVSLIPSFNSIECKLLKGRDENMTLSSQQFLGILSGTHRDHAVLLTNFFLYLSSSNPDFAADVFLAGGCSIPDGKTTWVMRRCKKNREVVLWDAITGCAYLQGDESCPLQKIYYLVSTDNAYANIQLNKFTPLLDFDVSNPRMWAPLLGGKFKTTMMNVQDKTLHYTPPDNMLVRQLQIEVCESVQNAIRGWRQVPTSFRPDISVKIGGMIDKLEQAKLNGNSSSNSEMALPESITRARAVFGFALHVPFTGVESLIERVKATEIHRNRNPRVEYTVAVRAFMYPGGVISLWVFVCSIVES